MNFVQRYRMLPGIERLDLVSIVTFFKPILEFLHCSLDESMLPRARVTPVIIGSLALEAQKGSSSKNDTALLCYWRHLSCLTPLSCITSLCTCLSVILTPFIYVLDAVRLLFSLLFSPFFHVDTYHCFLVSIVS